jgi:hypothetical protein
MLLCGTAEYEFMTDVQAAAVAAAASLHTVPLRNDAGQTTCHKQQFNAASYAMAAPRQYV